uniref:NIPSNAP family containing protein n=1 Tax=Paracoccus sp. TRP TaxID=412597 RepID=UPI000225FB52|nr:NIPSNAP family containing protein [Paracoccus sp. TRP]
MPRLIEILLYKLKPGTGGEFFDIMHNISVPLHRQNGIDVIWHGQSMHDPDGYGLIRGFADMAELDEAQSAFYAGDAWKTGPREAIISRIETATKIIIPMNADAVRGLREQGYHAITAARHGF